ncbi:fasciclin domain-containing protein [Chitinophaga pendula]|uniref:fasciclin domain-containing protein n=1 Tax=Chitinophaga TaxID=79328 RepID=UPI0018DF6C60|nr:MULTISPECIES: fasciclin domain-containing protein [Chitinophaga]UCJ07418.1 fasciclin domain-containing protein [Chitinophaga pendula]
MKMKKTLPALFLLSLLGLSACVKEDDLQMSEFDNNRINLVVADNFNLSIFNAVLRRSTLDKVLQQGIGPYTLLAPSDQALVRAGYNSRLAVLSADATTIVRIANYHTLDGRYELNKLPYLFNQELRSRGGKMFATHWIKGTDTILTINGARVIAANIPASNGVVQVVDQVLTPYLHDRLGNAVAAGDDITLFSQALKTSGLLETINGEGPFTIFAPNNDAMIARGYTTVQQILATDPQELKELVSYHIVRDRRFIYDYILSTGPSNATRQAMLNGNSVDIKLLPDPQAPGSFNSISLKGIGNTNETQLSRRDILTGNGVLHVINGTLRTTR